MARFIVKTKAEIGASPFEVKYRGEERSDPVLLRLIDFDGTNLEESELKDVENAKKYMDTDTVTWLNVDGLHEPKLLEKISEIFKFDKVVISDTLDTHQRSNVVEYDGCLYVTLKMLQYDAKSEEIVAENLSLVIADRVLISFQEQRGDVFEPVRERIRKGKKKIRNSGTDYLAYTLLDIVVDNYIYIISKLGEKIEGIEDQLLNEPNKKTLAQINRYKREMNYLRKSIYPAREMIHNLGKLDTEFLDEDTVAIHLSDLRDNMVMAIETSDSYREILSDQLNIYHTTISTKLNDVMKFLTIFSVIFIPLTFIAGIYGTNFDHLPELHYKYSYYVMWSVMILLALVMIRYFRIKKWL